MLACLAVKLRVTLLDKPAVAPTGLLSRSERQRWLWFLFEPLFRFFFWFFFSISWCVAATEGFDFSNQSIQAILTDLSFKRRHDRGIASDQFCLWSQDRFPNVVFVGDNG